MQAQVCAVSLPLQMQSLHGLGDGDVDPESLAVARAVASDGQHAAASRPIPQRSGWRTSAPQRLRPSPLACPTHALCMTFAHNMHKLSGDRLRTECICVCVGRPPARQHPVTCGRRRTLGSVGGPGQAASQTVVSGVRGPRCAARVLGQPSRHQG